MLVDAAGVAGFEALLVGAAGAAGAGGFDALLVGAAVALSKRSTKEAINSEMRTKTKIFPLARKVDKYCLKLASSFKGL